MSILRRLERRDYQGGGMIDPFGPPNWQIPTNGQLSIADGSAAIDGHQAMRHPAFWACARLISDVLSTLPLDLIVGGEPAVTLPTKLVSPSAYATSLQWRYQATMSLLSRGNAYGLIAAFDRLGYPSQIDLVAPETVKPDLDASGRKVFKVHGGKVLSTDQMWHLPGPQFPGELEGMSPIRYAARTIGLGLDAQKFGSDFYRNGINPTAVAETDQTVTEIQAKQITDRLYDAARNRRTPVLGGGIKLKPWQINPEESQFLETQRLNAVAVAQIFGVPPEMIGAATPGSTLTYANREQRAQDFLNNAINPWLARFEEALSALFPRGQVVKFNTGALLRSDLQTRFVAYDLATGHRPWMLPSEARALEDWAPVAGIDDMPAPPPPAVPPAPISGAQK